MANELYIISHFSFNATLAQLVEQLIRNEQVVGSSPMSGSQNSIDLNIYIKHLSFHFLYFCIFAD